MLRSSPSGPTHASSNGLGCFAAGYPRRRRTPWFSRLTLHVLPSFRLWLASPPHVDATPARCGGLVAASKTGAALTKLRMAWQWRLVRRVELHADLAVTLDPAPGSLAADGL